MGKTQSKKKYLSLEDLREEYGFNPNTIKRERYEQKAVTEKRLKPEDVRNASGFGYTTEAYQMYGKLMYKKKWEKEDRESGLSAEEITGREILKVLNYVTEDITMTLELPSEFNSRYLPTLDCQMVIRDVVIKGKPCKQIL